MTTRTLLSPATLARPRGKAVYWTVFTGVVVLFALAFLFPVYWMVTGAMKSPDEVAQTPPTIIPKHWQLSGYTDAWDLMQLPEHLWNTVVQAMRRLDLPARSVHGRRLRPVQTEARLRQVDPRRHPGDADGPGPGTGRTEVPDRRRSPADPHQPAERPAGHLAVEAVANAFNLYLLKRFFDQLPRDILEAAEIDGAGKLRVLWSIVLPMSRPVLGVVSIFALVAVWQDFLWPLMVFSDTDKQPISVALVQLSQNIQLTVLIAAMVIASIPMVAMFLVFQRHIIAGISAGSTKG